MKYYVVLEFAEVKYCFHCDDFGIDDDGVKYQWLDGNYACDCNRALFIRRLCDGIFSDSMPCGNTIRLLSIRREHGTVIVPQVRGLAFGVDANTVGLEAAIGSSGLRRIANAMAAPISVPFDYRGIGNRLLEIKPMASDDIPIYDIDIPSSPRRRRRRNNGRSTS